MVIRRLAQVLVEEPTITFQPFFFQFLMEVLVTQEEQPMLAKLLIRQQLVQPIMLLELPIFLLLYLSCLTIIF